MHIEILDRKQFEQITDLYKLKERRDLDLGHADKLIKPFDLTASTFVFNILTICGLKNRVDFLVHGSIIDFDDIDHGW